MLKRIFSHPFNLWFLKYKCTNKRNKQKFGELHIQREIEHVLKKMGGDDSDSV